MASNDNLVSSSYGFSTEFNSARNEKLKSLAECLHSKKLNFNYKSS